MTYCNSDIEQAYHHRTSLIPVCGLNLHTLKKGALFLKKAYLNLTSCIWSRIVRNSEGNCAIFHNSILFLPSAIATKRLHSELYRVKSLDVNSRLISSYVNSCISKSRRKRIDKIKRGYRIYSNSIDIIPNRLLENDSQKENVPN